MNEDRLLLQSIKDYAIFMLNPQGIIASWNEGAKRIKGYTADEIIGKHFSIFYTKEDLDDKKPERELKIAVATKSAKSPTCASYCGGIASTAADPAISAPRS